MDNAAVRIRCVGLFDWGRDVLDVRVVLPRVSKSDAPEVVRHKVSYGGHYVYDVYRGYGGALWQSYDQWRPLAVEDFNKRVSVEAIDFSEGFIQELVLTGGDLENAAGLDYEKIRERVSMVGCRSLPERFLLIGDELWCRTDGPQVSLDRRWKSVGIVRGRQMFENEPLENAAFLSALDAEACMEALDGTGVTVHDDWPEVLHPELVPANDGLSQSMMWLLASRIWSSDLRIKDYDAALIAAVVETREALEAATSPHVAGMIMDRRKGKAIIRGGGEWDADVLRPAIIAWAEAERSTRLRRRVGFLADVLGSMASIKAAKQEFPDLNGIRL